VTKLEVGYGFVVTTLPDPRPRIRDDAESPTLDGSTCQACGLHTLSTATRCPDCRGELAPATFGPLGLVWSSTVVRVPVPGRTPPYPMSYVDLVDGPRVLCHLSGPAETAPVGATVSLCGATADGDLMAEVVKEVER